jgi:hypothetical protein
VKRGEDVRFGSYSDLRGTAVFRDPWWFRCASAVQLDGPPVWDALSELLRARASDAKETFDAVWFLERVPVALQIPPPPELVLDVLACRVQDGSDVAYPFIVRERNGTVVCGFSTLGPEPGVRLSILSALADRFLWAPSSR